MVKYKIKTLLIGEEMDFFDCLDISDSKRKDLRKISLLKDNWIGGGYGESINSDTLHTTGIFLQEIRRKAADNTLVVPTGAGGVVLTCFDGITSIKDSETLWSAEFYNSGEAALFIHDGNHDDSFNFNFTEDSPFNVALAMVKIIDDCGVLHITQGCF